MTTLHVGAVLDRLPTRRYAEQLAFCEYAPRAPLPRVPTLTRWWHQRKHATGVGLLAPRATFVSDRGAMRLEAVPRERFDWLVRAARALEATYVLLATGSDLTPGARDRARLAEYCRELAAQSERPVVWAPGGLWEPEAAAEHAAGLGVTVAVDVLEHAPPPGPTVIGRLSARGARARLGPGHLDMAVQAVAAAGAQTAYLTVEAEPALAKALALRGAAAAFAEDDPELSLAEPVRVTAQG